MINTEIVGVDKTALGLKVSFQSLSLHITPNNCTELSIRRSAEPRQVFHVWLSECTFNCVCYSAVRFISKKTVGLRFFASVDCSQLFEVSRACFCV